MARAMPSWFPFLKIEANIAITFINMASTSSPGNAARLVGHALKALAQIQRGLSDPDYHGLTQDHVVFLERRCVEIELALFKVDNLN